MKNCSNNIILTLLVLFVLTNNWTEAVRDFSVILDHEKVGAVDVDSPLDLNIELIDSSDDEEGSGFFHYKNLDLPISNFNYAFSNPNSLDKVVDLNYYILYCCLKLDC